MFSRSFFLKVSGFYFLEENLRYKLYKELKLRQRQIDNMTLYQHGKDYSLFYCIVDSKRLFCYNPAADRKDPIKGWYQNSKDTSWTYKNLDKYCKTYQRWYETCSSWWKESLQSKEICEVTKLEVAMNNLQYLYHEKFYDVIFQQRKFNRRCKIEDWVKQKGKKTNTV